jgi:hypothetical protein
MRYPCTPSDCVWELLSSGNLAGAVSVVRGAQYPCAEIVGQLQEILQTETLALDFTNSEELRLVRLAAAGAWIFGVHERYEWFYPEGFAWPHPVSPDRAAMTLLRAYRAQTEVRPPLKRDAPPASTWDAHHQALRDQALRDQAARDARSQPGNEIPAQSGRV